MHGVDHDETEIAAAGEMLERYRDSRSQLVDGQTGTQGQAQIGTLPNQRADDRRNLREMTETVRGNIDEQMGGHDERSRSSLILNEARQ